MAVAIRRPVSPAYRFPISLLALCLAAALVARPAQAQNLGKYSTCATCHQANGQGIPGAFPPLAGSEYATAADATIPIHIVLLGAQGPITVKGQRFNSTMPSWASLSDADLAAALTYVRSHWGNTASAVTAAQVAAERRALAGRTRALTGAEIEAMLRGH